MARKGFQHNRLLDVKAMLLNLKAFALRKSEDHQRSESTRLREIRGEKEAHLAKQNPTLDEAGQSISSRELQIRTWYTEQLNEDLREQVHNVQKAEKEVHKRRKVVEQSAKEKKTLEKLKEHQDRESRREISREEQKQLDEIAGRQRLLKGRSERS